ncbi:MAG: polyprenyl synthetase family protein [Nocardioidaceae bacterium]
MSDATAPGQPPVDPIPAELQAAVSTTLDEFIDRQADSLAALGADLTPLISAARQATSGGKRLRPAFAYWGWRASGGSATKTQPITTAAAAIELVHASALLHDDVIDDSATRRGKPSAHHEFAALRRVVTGEGESRRFGRSAAILLGDLLLSWSDELLAESGFKPKALTQGRFYFDRLRTEVVAGQYLDVLGQTTSRSSAADAMRVVRYKSAKYTVERPLQMGAALAQADPTLLAALSSYGVPLGEAFQLRDDVLGVFGEPTVTGKPAGDDIREGKRTLLVARANDLATEDQSAVLKAYFGNPGVGTDGIEAVQDVMRASGALDAVETVIAELTAAGLSALSHAKVADEESRAALQALSELATNRQH